MQLCVGAEVETALADCTAALAGLSSAKQRVVETFIALGRALSRSEAWKADDCAPIYWVVAFAGVSLPESPLRDYIEKHIPAELSQDYRRRLVSLAMLAARLPDLKLAPIPSQASDAVRLYKVCARKMYPDHARERRRRALAGDSEDDRGDDADAELSRAPPRPKPKRRAPSYHAMSSSSSSAASTTDDDDDDSDCTDSTDRSDEKALSATIVADLSTSPEVVAAIRTITMHLPSRRCRRVLKRVVKQLRSAPRVSAAFRRGDGSEC